MSALWMSTQNVRTYQSVNLSSLKWKRKIGIALHAGLLVVFVSVTSLMVIMVYNVTVVMNGLTPCVATLTVRHIT